ncbi:MAG: hypothetical protein Q8P40_08285 [Nitrospirota bacterium]|nr:hypothetical protein [Nitrospirota bacterium]
MKKLKRFLVERTRWKFKGWEMHFREYQDIIKSIDWDLLQQQKKTLEKLLTNLSSHPTILNEDINDLWGLIELIENLQDVPKNEPNNIVHFEGMRRG